MDDSAIALNTLLNDGDDFADTFDIETDLVFPPDFAVSGTALNTPVRLHITTL